VGRADPRARGLPSAFIAEAKFSGDAFRLFRWRSPETRMQMYLETAITREDYAKEVKLYQLGPLLLERYREIFDDLYGEDRKLTLRRGVWGYGSASSARRLLRRLRMDRRKAVPARSRSAR
jgi:hypothetical protein